MTGRAGGFQALDCMHRPRDAARDSPALWCHKPKTPAGRRGASLTLTADYRARDQSSPARFTAPSNRGGIAGGGFRKIGRGPTQPIGEGPTANNLKVE